MVRLNLFFFLILLLLISCREQEKIASEALLARFEQENEFFNMLPPAPAQLGEQLISSSRPASLVIRKLKLPPGKTPIAAILLGGTSRTQIDNSFGKNFSQQFALSSPEKGNDNKPQSLSYGDTGDISGYLSYANETLTIAMRGYRNTSLVGLKTDVDSDPNTSNRTQRLFWFPKAFLGPGEIVYDNLHLLVIYATKLYPSGLDFMRANERINNSGPIQNLAGNSYQIFNVQGKVTLIP